jgi:hypothetical protein
VTELVRYDAACRALAEAKGVEEVKRIRDRGKALAACARIANNRQLEIDATEIRFRAEHRLGQMLAEQKKTVGLNTSTAGQGRPALGGSSKEPPKDVPTTLADVGIDKKLSMRAQKLAVVSDAEFAAKLAAWRKNAEERQERITANLLSAGERRGRKSNGHSPHADCIQLDDLRHGWDDSGLAVAISRLMQAAWQAPDAPDKGDGDPAAATQEAIGEMESWVVRLRHGRCDDDAFGA